MTSIVVIEPNEDEFIWKFENENGKIENIK